MAESYKKVVPKTPLPPRGKLQDWEQLRKINENPDLSRAELKIMIEIIIATATDLCCENKIPKLAKKTKLSDRQIQRAIKSLEQKDYLIVEKRPNKGSIYLLGNKLRSEMPTFEDRQSQELEIKNKQELQLWQQLLRDMCKQCPEGRETWRRMTTDELQIELRVMLDNNADYYWGVFQDGDRTYVERVNTDLKTGQLVEYQGVTQHQAQCEQVNKGENDVKKDVFTEYQWVTSAGGDIGVTTLVT